MKTLKLMALFLVFAANAPMAHAVANVCKFHITDAKKGSYVYCEATIGPTRLDQANVSGEPLLADTETFSVKCGGVELAPGTRVCEQQQITGPVRNFQISHASETSCEFPMIKFARRAPFTELGNARLLLSKTSYALGRCSSGGIEP